MDRNEVIKNTKENCYNDNNKINLTNQKLQENFGSNSRDKSNYILDDIISEYGYSIEVWKIIIACYFILFIDGYNCTYFYSMIIPYKELFKLEDHQLSFVGSLFYISKGLGFISVGILTKLINRIYLAKTILFFLIVLGFSREISTNFNYLIFNRAITGILVGIIEIIATNVLCESLPRRFRAFTMIITWGGYAIGQFTPNLIMLFTMPHLEVAGVTKTHLVNSLINFILFIIVFIFFKDSPRNLILNGYDKEAMEILFKMKNNSKNNEHENSSAFFSHDFTKKIISQVKDSNKTSSASYLEIFNKDLLVFTLCALVIFFNNNFYGDGFTLISTLILKEKLHIEQNKEPGKLLRDSILMQMFNLFGNLLCGFLVEIKFIGRRRSLLILMTSIITICLMCIVFMEHIAIFMSIFNLLNLIGDVMIVYTSEVYPTRIRDLGTGLINSVALSGSVISQYAFIYIFNVHFLTPFYVIIGLISVSIIAALFIPIESFERPLDVGGMPEGTADTEEKILSNFNSRKNEDEEKLLGLKKY